MISATVVGNVGKDSEVQMTPSGTPILKFSVASSTKVKGEDVTTWVNCAMFGARGEKLAEYIKKGGQIAATGGLQLRTYTTKDGKHGASLEMNVSDVKLLGSKSDQPRAHAPAQAVEDDPLPF